MNSMNKVDILILDDSSHVINFLLNRKINIYNIKATSKGNVYTISNKDIEKIPFDIKILSFSGIKRYLYGIKRCKYFIIGIIISIIEMFLLSHVILEIDVLHNEKEIRDLLYEELENNGIHQFMIKKSFQDIQNIKTKIKNNNKDKIEWLEIIDDGMKYTVRVEKREKVSTKKESKFCDIISTKDAVILNSAIYRGQANVDINDFVKKGSTLINGEIKFNEETKAYTCAEGEIFGNTWYTVNIKIPSLHTIKRYTDNKKVNFSIGYKDNEKTVFKSHFKKYDIIKRKLIKIGEFKIYKVLEQEYVEATQNYTSEELTKVALKQARKKIKEKIGDKGTIIFEKVLQTDEYDSIIVMDIFYSIKEPIGERVEREIPLERMQENGTS